jgi:hypothetical protein
MNPRTFQATFVDGNIAEFRNNARDLRRAANAIWAIDALAAHIFAWAKANPPDKISASDDTGYREELAGQCEGFRVLRDAAKAMKHAELDRGKPIIKSSEDLRARGGGFQGGAFQGSAFHTPAAVVQLPSGSVHKVADLITASMVALEAEMVRLGVP